MGQLLKSPNPLIVALDVDAGGTAIELAERLKGVVGAVKVGSRLFTAEGPPLVGHLVDAGHRVFLDLKFHDIPHTVSGAVAAAARLGVWMMTVHAAGGAAMMRAAKAAADQYAASSGHPAPLLVAITVLTSLDAQTIGSLGITRTVADQVAAMARLAREAGMDGVVASSLEIGVIREACGAAFTIVTPGIRGRGSAGDDQARTSSAAEALRAGANYLVVGRPILQAADPRAAAEQLLAL